MRPPGYDDWGQTPDARRPPHVSILIPSCGQRALANLARDAIAAFTPDVSHDVRLLDHAWARRGWPQIGSVAVGESLAQLAAGLAVVRPSHVFVMHDDALPLYAGWLSYLLQQPGPVTGVKLTEGTKMAHGSGVLFTYAAFRAVDLRPDLPHRDAGEAPADWCAPSLCWRPSRVERQGHGLDPTWWRRFSCDVSFDDEAAPFYVHFGGGSLNNRPDRDAWIGAARQALGL